MAVDNCTPWNCNYRPTQSATLTVECFNLKLSNLSPVALGWQYVCWRIVRKTANCRLQSSETVRRL